MASKSKPRRKLSVAKKAKPASTRVAAVRKKTRPAPTTTAVMQQRAGTEEGKSRKAGRSARGKDAAFERFLEWLEQAPRKINTEDLEALMLRAKEIRTTVHGTAAVGYYWNTSKRVFGYLRDYWNGTHRDVPWYSITAAVAATVYVLSPVDLIPDFIPVLGSLDDAAVIAGCLALIERDLQAREARSPGSTKRG